MGMGENYCKSKDLQSNLNIIFLDMQCMVISMVFALEELLCSVCRR